MPLGVLNNISAVYAENNLNQTQSSLQNVLTQLSSGSRINSGADDPAGLSIANGLAANSAALTQSSSNASEGAGFLQVADGSLSQVTSLLTTAVTLATEAGGGTLSNAQLGAANQEYQDILTQIGTIGSTTEYNGIAVFSAASVAATTALSFTGGTNPVASFMGGGAPASTTPTGAGTGASPYVFNLTQGDTLSGGFTVTSAGGAAGASTVVDLTNPTYAGLSSTSQATETTAATALQTALNGMSATTGSAYTVTDVGGVVSISSNGQGGVGHTEAITITGSTAKQVAPLGTTLSLGTTLTGSLVLNSTGGSGNGSQTINFSGDASLAGLTSTTQSAETTAAAALQSLLNAGVGNLSTQTGSTYSVGDVNGVLTISSNKGAENLSTAGSSLHEGTTVSANLTLGDALSGSIAIASAGGSVGSSSQIINLASYSGLASSNSATRSAAIGALQTALNTGGGLAASGSQYGVAVSNAGVLTITTNGSDALTITPTNADESTAVTGGINIYAGDGTTNGSQNYNVTVGALSDTSVGTSPVSSSAGSAVTVMVGGVTGTGGTSAGAGSGANLSGTALDTQADAEAALQTVTNAISAVAYQRGQVGANINTLTAASNIASSQETNITAAQNTISATDYASATANMSKYEILTQTGISALAQANSTQQMVTKLLQ
jgi:flagellin